MSNEPCTVAINCGATVNQTKIGIKATANLFSFRAPADTRISVTGSVGGKMINLASNQPTKLYNTLADSQHGAVKLNLNGREIELIEELAQYPESLGKPEDIRVAVNIAGQNQKKETWEVELLEQTSTLVGQTETQRIVGVQLFSVTNTLPDGVYDFTNTATDILEALMNGWIGFCPEMMVSDEDKLSKFFLGQISMCGTNTPGILVIALQALFSEDRQKILSFWKTMAESKYGVQVVTVNGQKVIRFVPTDQFFQALKRPVLDALEDAFRAYAQYTPSHSRSQWANQMSLKMMEWRIRPNLYINPRYAWQAFNKSSVAFAQTNTYSFTDMKSGIKGAAKGFGLSMLIIATFDTLEHFSSEKELPITDLLGDIGYDAATSAVATAVGAGLGAVLVVAGAPVILVATIGIGFSIVAGVTIDILDNAIHPDGDTWKNQFKDYLGELTE